MSALDWGNWLRSGVIVGPPVKRRPEFQINMTLDELGSWHEESMDRMVHQIRLAKAVRINRFVMVHICDTTKSALDG